MKAVWGVRLIGVFLLSLLLSFGSASAAVPENPRPVGMGLGGFNYWSSGPFANTMLTATDWLAFGSGEWGSRVFYEGNPQFDENGYPRYLNDGEKLRTLMWPYHAGHIDGGNATLPPRTRTGTGKWVVTWEGNADLRLETGVFLPGDSSGPATGSIVNGRRAYQVGGGDSLGHLVVHAVDAANPVTSIQVWLPDPEAPDTRSLEGRFWHPAFLANLRDMPLNHLRFMDWISTNQSPQRDWADRRPPAHRHQHGVLNRRSPAEGLEWYTDGEGNPVLFPGDRSTGIAWEHIVALANHTGVDPWICVPHLATDAYVRQLARLFRYGSDGVEPYDAPQANPVYPPLDPGLRLWVEQSNEIWSNGNSFPQGNWAQAQADAEGISKAAFNARRASEIWSIFQDVYGGAENLVRVAGIWTGSDVYTDPFLAELDRYGGTLSPAVRPDVIAPTTYFGNGIQDWVYQQALRERDGEEPWFLTPENFSSGGTTRPVSLPRDDPYWSGAAIDQHTEATFREWQHRIFSGASFQGGGPDATGTAGGFSGGLPHTIRSTFGRDLPIVAYEGGPSLYTDSYDGGSPEDDGITRFMIHLNRQPQFAEVYRTHLNLARSKGLDTHTLFVDVSRWGKFGQWGHLEFPDQNPDNSPKWSAVKEWAQDTSGLNPVDAPVGTRPAFQTPGLLPGAVYNQSYEAEIRVSGGEYLDGPTFRVVGSDLARGLQLEPVPGDPMARRLVGAPQAGGWSYLYLRATDDDGDAAWRIFRLFTSGGPGTLLDADFSGPFEPTSSLPASRTHALDDRVNWSGLDVGATYSPSGGSATGDDGTGVGLLQETDALRFFVSQGALSQSDSTLGSAIADDEYWAFTLTPAATPLDLRDTEVVLQWIRYEYHAPRAISVFTSIEGFDGAAALYSTPDFPSPNQPASLELQLPDRPAYAGVTAPVEFRFYFHGSQYGHKAGILGLKVTERLEPGSYAAWAAEQNWNGRSSAPSADANRNGLINFLEYAMDLPAVGPSTAASMLPTIRANQGSLPQGPSIDLEYRVRVGPVDPALQVEGSPNLTEWTVLQPDGANISQSIVDPDPDGDGSAERHRLRVHLPSPYQFFRVLAPATN